MWPNMKWTTWVGGSKLTFFYFFQGCSFSLILMHFFLNWTLQSWNTVFHWWPYNRSSKSWLGEKCFQGWESGSKVLVYNRNSKVHCYLKILILHQILQSLVLKIPKMSNFEINIGTILFWDILTLLPLQVKIESYDNWYLSQIWNNRMSI